MHLFIFVSDLENQFNACAWKLLRTLKYAHKILQILSNLLL